MAVPSYGAAPLAKTWLFIRLLQLVCFVTIIGITANFTAEIVANNYVVPHEIIGTLAVTSLATLYCLISIPFFWAQGCMTLLIMAAIDFLMDIAFVVIAVVLGKPLSYLNCFAIANSSNAGDAQSAYAFTQNVSKNVNKSGNFLVWIGATRNNCFESKTMWGLSIALCILFTSSVFVLPALFAKQKRAIKSAKGNA